MTTRVVIMMDAENYAAYKAEPHHQRSAWVNQMLRQGRHSPPLPPHPVLEQLRAYLDKVDRYYERQGRI